MKVHKISSERLTLTTIPDIIAGNYHLELSDDARRRIIRCREYLDKKIEKTNSPIYGVTTGFGSLCKISISQEHLSQLQINLMMSHACGIGDRVPNDIVRLMLLLKIQSLSYGFSGVKLETVQRLVDFFNNGICPIVYQQGSVGASGDLVPLAHLCLPMVGLGEVEYKGKIYSGAEILKEFKWEPIRLASKEGLALLNGTQNMAAHCTWALINAQRLCDWADVIAAMSLDAFEGHIDPFLEAIQRVRPHQGQSEVAAHFRQILDGSELIGQPKATVQDPYSFRCIPQVHGAIRDTVRYVRSVVDVEINSATDNPTVCPDEDLIINAGNFHGEPIAMPMDFLSVAMTELGNISERRIYNLVSGERNLPSFLVAQPGVNSGFMIPQYTAAAIANENKTLCMPSSADTIPTSQGQEDHVSMGANAATKLCRVIRNTERILAIELFNAAQALEFRRPLKSSPLVERIFKDYRKVVPFIREDELMYPHIAHSVEFLQNETLD